MRHRTHVRQAPPLPDHRRRLLLGLNEAVACLRNDDKARAERILRRLTSQHPDQPEALGLYGSLLQNSGRSVEAMPLLQRAVRLSPNEAAHWCNLGAACHHAGDAGAALQAWRRAIALDPTRWEAHLDIANVLEKQSEYRQAESFLRLCLQHNTECGPAWAALGRICARLGNLPEAVACLNRSLQLAPTAESWCDLAQTFLKGQRPDAALAATRESISLNPRLALAHCQMGKALCELEQLAEARRAFDTALTVDPACADAMEGMAIAATRLCNPEEAVSWYVRAMELRPTRSVTHSSLLFTLSASSAATPERLLEAHQGWARMHAAGAPAFHHVPRAQDAARKLRIGFVSGDFRDHPVRFFVAPILRGLDRNQFEVVCYSTCPYADFATAKLRTLADQWHEVADASDAELAGRIRNHRIDVLVDLSGHTLGNRLPVFARKPAPVQVTWLGYLGTTGLAQMDYWLTDWTIHPPDTPQRTTEKIWRLPRCWVVYEPPASAPEVAGRDGAGPVTFVSFNASQKLSAQSIQLWARVLAALPESRLLIKAHGLDGSAERAVVLERLARAGVAPERVTLMGRVSSREAHLALFGSVDIALDTTPYSGGTTTAETLWMGVPVVTLPGALMPSRMSASMLHAIGLDEFIARDEGDFVRIAVDLAGNAGHRAQLRRELRARVAASPLCDGAGLAREIGSAFRQMWMAWCTSTEEGGAR